MKIINQTILAGIVGFAITAISASSAFAAISTADGIPENFNFNIGSEVMPQLTLDSIDIELVARICENDLDKHVCLGEGIAQALER